MTNAVFFLIALVSCSQLDLRTMKEKYPKNFKTISVYRPSDGPKTVESRHKFLKLLFEESYEPLYGAPKWGKACLEATKFKFVKEGRMSAHLAQLWTDEKGEPGYCRSEILVQKRQELLVYCEGQSSVTKGILPPDLKIVLKEALLCP